MRIHVESWAPEFGSPVEGEGLAESDAEVDVGVELPAGDWQPLYAPDSVAAEPRVAFVDGVRRIEARVWITDDDGATRMGICGSWGAGIALCEGSSARIEGAAVRRGLFARAGAPDIETKAGVFRGEAVAGGEMEHLSLGLLERMRGLESDVASTAAEDLLLVLDGPLTAHHGIPEAVGYIKTHRVSYLAEAETAVVSALGAAQRTPVFLMRTSWSRYSWYLRLTAEVGHPWAGIVRCEAPVGLRLEEVTHLADRTARTLPRFASAPHKDPRAPQNLYPIAALERDLRRRLGDTAWVWRALKVATA
jgi:hypothetical protein